MSLPIRFSRVDIDRNEYVSANGCWLIEKTWVDGPRGGLNVRWNLWEVVDGRHHQVASEALLRDLWRHLEPVADEHPCPAGDECALNKGAVHCKHCHRNWPPDETWAAAEDTRE